MASPIIPSSPIDPPINLPAQSSTNADLTITTTDTIGLYDFLHLISTTKDAHKHTLVDSKVADALINKDYFLAVFQDINALLEKYVKTGQYADSLNVLTDNYNGIVDNLNTQIDTYNTAKNTLNSRINTMNNAINTINGKNPPTPAEIATYNAAVAAYNSYLTSTGNPALLSYKNSADTIYNNPINNANTVTIPALNQLIDELGLGIPHVAPFTPGSAPAGANPPLPGLGNYTGATIPLIAPTNYGNLGHLNRISNAKSKDDIIGEFFSPYAKNFLETLAATNKKLAGMDDYNAFINFIQKQGFNLNPAAVSAFINKSEKKGLPASSSGAGGNLGSSMIGIDTPKLERILSTALFSALAAAESFPIPPNAYDQINLFALTLLSTIGASAGLGVVQQLGETLKSLKPDNPAIQLALTASILQNILKVVADSKVTKDGISDITKDIPGLSSADQSALADKLATAQNTSLLLLGGLSTALSLKSPNLVQDFLNTAFNQAATTSSNIYSENPFSPRSLNDFLNNDNNVSIVRNELSDHLKSTGISYPKPNEIVNKAIDTTISNLPQNANQDQLRQELSKNLQDLGVGKAQAETVAANISSFINLQAAPITQRPVLSPAELEAQTRSAIAAITKEDATRSTSDATIEKLVKNLTDTTNPTSFISLLTSQVQTLVKSNDKKVSNEFTELLRAYMSPNIDTFVVAENMRDPANNVTLSFMTGLMYDRGIPSNWQRPLSIQV